MAQFSYKARRRSGEVVQGMLDVADRSAALIQIQKLGLLPVLLEPAKGSAAPGKEREPRMSGTLMPPALRAYLKRQKRPKLQELATFTQQLANLLKSGMPLTVALNSMSHLESKGISSQVSKDLKQDVMEGRSLSDAMARQSLVFSDLYVNMVKAGEQSGGLIDVLERMAQHFERFSEVQAKFVSALIYPAVVSCVGVVIIIFFMTFMLPKFLAIFEGMKMQLPASTQILIGISHLFSHYWWLMLLVLLCIFILFKRFQSSERGKQAIDDFKMKAPVIGKVVKLNLFAQFARTLGTLLQNGVPVLTALKITEQIMPNRVIREAIAKTREEVTDGKTIAQPLARSKIFPQLMLDLLTIGEETGDVPGALQNVASTYENELSIALRVMTNLIEPVMIIFMAMGVGFLLFCILSAMFAMTANIAR